MLIQDLEFPRKQGMPIQELEFPRKQGISFAIWISQDSLTNQLERLHSYLRKSTEYGTIEMIINSEMLGT